MQEVISLSRAFVKEDDGEQASLRDDDAHARKTLEWLRLQEKKLGLLLNDPKGQAIDAQKRQKWIAEIRADIEKTKAELGL